MTPNRVTWLAVAASAVTVTAFIAQWYSLGGFFFILRFFIDCLDGKVAREQGSSTETGAAFDLIADVSGIACVTAALAWSLADAGHLTPGLGFALMAAMLVYQWALAKRKHLADEAREGTGGAELRELALPMLAPWLRLCRRLNMSPIPWSVDVEIAMLGLAPLLLAPADIEIVLTVGFAFFAVASLINIRRIVHLARRLDAHGRAQEES